MQNGFTLEWSNACAHPDMILKVKFRKTPVKSPDLNDMKKPACILFVRDIEINFDPIDHTIADLVVKYVIYSRTQRVANCPCMYEGAY